MTLLPRLCTHVLMAVFFMGGLAVNMAVANDQEQVILEPDELFGPSGVNRRILETRLHTPRGYKPVWDDGRLNPLSGAGTLRGEAAMDGVWSNTVPRRLIEVIDAPKMKLR